MEGFSIFEYSPTAFFLKYIFKVADTLEDIH